MEAINIVKISGNVIDDAAELEQFLDSFARLPHPKILIHGGGKAANKLTEKLGIPIRMEEGRRITDAETLDIAVMTYAGLLNKQIVAKLQKRNVFSLGLSGADLSIITARKRPAHPVDFGFVGDVSRVDWKMLKSLLLQHITPVIAPITHDGSGQLLNTNADSIACFVSKALATDCTVHLWYCFEQPGVMTNGEILPAVSREMLHTLKTAGVITGGMIPKLETGLDALDAQVASVWIGHHSAISQLPEPASGTFLIKEKE